MIPHRDDVLDYKDLVTSMEVTIMYRRLLRSAILQNADLTLSLSAHHVSFGTRTKQPRREEGGKSYMLECQPETAQYVAYSDVNSEWEL